MIASCEHNILHTGRTSTDTSSIRVLNHDDHRKRRLSGRDQVSSGGRHLIDGLPFGRTRLKSPADRPAVRIPAQKRLRHTYEQSDDINAEPDSPTLLLTDGRSHNSRRASSTVRFEDDLNDDDDDSTADYSNSGDSSTPSSVDEMDEDDSEGENLEVEDEEESLSESSGDEDLEQEVLDLAKEDKASGQQDSPMVDSPVPGSSDKLSALRAAFPKTPVDVCERVLAARGMGLDAAYRALADGFKPELSREAVLAWKPPTPKGKKKQAENKLSNSSRPAKSKQSPIAGAASKEPPPGASNHDEEEDNDDEEEEVHNDDLIRKFGE